MSYFTTKDLLALRMTPALEARLAVVLGHPCEGDDLVCALWNELRERREEIRVLKDALAERDAVDPGQV